MAPNPIITTIQDFDPNKIKLTNKIKNDFYNAVKHKLQDGSFELEKSVARKLEFQNLIKDHTAGRDENRNQIYTGRYVLDVFGALYIEHLQSTKRKDFVAGLQGWATTVIALIALLIALGSLGWQIYEYYHPKSTENAPIIYSETRESTIAGIEKHNENHHGKSLFII